MQLDSNESSEQFSQTSNLNASSSSQHGFHDSPPSEPARLRSAGSGSASAWFQSIPKGSAVSDQGIDPDKLNERLRRLSSASSRPASPRMIPGQRVSDHENALTPATPRQALGFKVVKRSNPPSGSIQLIDFPNGM
jgi:hypothetical protein